MSVMKEEGEREGVVDVRIRGIGTDGSVGQTHPGSA